MDFIKEFIDFPKVRKKYWLLAIVICLIIFVGLIILSNGSSIAPFMYILF